MSHAVLDQRDLEIGRIVAQRLRENFELIDRALSNVARWRKTAAPGVLPVLNEWEELLCGPIECVIQVLTTDDNRCRRLRQSTPFTQVLSNTERNQIILKFNPNDPTTT